MIRNTLHTINQKTTSALVLKTRAPNTTFHS